MQKQAPSIGRIMVAAGFALSCFALLLFLWVTFGGPVPFKPASYRFTADFPEAITLQKEADVRIGGVTVGKVKEMELPPDGNATRATIEIEPEYAPISSDAKAILRLKTLLGETYVELTSGNEGLGEDGEGATAQGATIDVGKISGDDASEPIEEGGHLEDSQVAEQVQIDEIFNALDEETRTAFQRWMKGSAIAVDGRGLDLNDAFGNIGPFSSDAADVLGTLRRQEEALRTLVRSTGEVFGALTARDQELAGAIVGSNRTFRALASRDEALAETFQIFPTFERESRFTLDRLEHFALNTRPLISDLKPVARDLSPTLRDLRRLAPNARRLFRNLNPLIKASRTGMPALRSFLRELRPVMVALDPFLANLNPIVRYLDFYKAVAGDFLANPSAATSGALPPKAGQPNPRHLSRQLSIFSSETLSIHPERLAINRGHGYLLPGAITNTFSNSQGEVFPSYDCNNTGASGGFGNGMVTPEQTPFSAPGFPYNPSDPPAQEGGYFPLSNQIPPSAPDTALPGLLPPPLDFIPAGTTVGGSMAMVPPCTLQSFNPLGEPGRGNFPALFGGGELPQVLADP